ADLQCQSDPATFRRCEGSPEGVCRETQGSVQGRVIRACRAVSPGLPRWMGRVILAARCRSGWLGRMVRDRACTDAWPSPQRLSVDHLDGLSRGIKILQQPCVDLYPEPSGDGLFRLGVPDG